MGAGEGRGLVLPTSFPLPVASCPAFSPLHAPPGSVCNVLIKSWLGGGGGGDGE